MNGCYINSIIATVVTSPLLFPALNPFFHRPLIDGVESVVIGGGVFIHSLIPRAGAVTFENYITKHFLEHTQMELRKPQRLDIVWDTYWESSIKVQTRDDRGIGVRLK